MLLQHVWHSYQTTMFKYKFMNTDLWLPWSWGASVFCLRGFIFSIFIVLFKWQQNQAPIFKSYMGKGAQMHHMLERTRQQACQQLREKEELGRNLGVSATCYKRYAPRSLPAQRRTRRVKQWEKHKQRKCERGALLPTASQRTARSAAELSPPVGFGW